MRRTRPHAPTPLPFRGSLVRSALRTEVVYSLIIKSDVSHFTIAEFHNGGHFGQKSHQSATQTGKPARRQSRRKPRRLLHPADANRPIMLTQIELHSQQISLSTRFLKILTIRSYVESPTIEGVVAEVARLWRDGKQRQSTAPRSPTSGDFGYDASF